MAHNQVNKVLKEGVIKSVNVAERAHKMKIEN